QPPAVRLLLTNRVRSVLRVEAVPGDGIEVRVLATCSHTFVRCDLSRVERRPRPSPRRVFPLGLRREPVPLTRVDTLRAEGEALADKVHTHRPAAALEVEAGGEPLLLRAPVGVGGCFVPAEVIDRTVRLVATVGSAVGKALWHRVSCLLPFCDRDL